VDHVAALAALATPVVCGRIAFVKAEMLKTV